MIMKFVLLLVAKPSLPILLPLLSYVFSAYTNSNSQHTTHILYFSSLINSFQGPHSSDHPSCLSWLLAGWARAKQNAVALLWLLWQVHQA